MDLFGMSFELFPLLLREHNLVIFFIFYFSIFKLKGKELKLHQLT